MLFQIIFDSWAERFNSSGEQDRFHIRPADLLVDRTREKAQSHEGLGPGKVGDEAIRLQ